MKLYKLEEGRLIQCPTILLTRYGQVKNPSVNQQIGAGYKMLNTEMPELTECEEAVFVEYREEEDKITAVYESVRLSEEELRRRYEEAVERVIREKYNLSEELSILRQRDSKPAEFIAYNEWCELAKTKSRLTYYGN